MSLWFPQSIIIHHLPTHLRTGDAGRLRWEPLLWKLVDEVSAVGWCLPWFSWRDRGSINGAFPNTMVFNTKWLGWFGGIHGYPLYLLEIMIKKLLDLNPAYVSTDSTENPTVLLVYVPRMNWTSYPMFLYYISDLFIFVQFVLGVWQCLHIYRMFDCYV